MFGGLSCNWIRIACANLTTFPDRICKPHHVQAARVLQMFELCPYQSIRNAAYPPVLVTCSASDARVPTWGPAKWVAKLRQHQQAEAPILLLSNSQGGHFSHDADLLNNAAMEYAFLLDALQQSP